MNKASVSQSATSFLPPAHGILQRKCACGTHTMSGGQCAGCAKKKRGLQRKLTIGASNDPLEREAGRIAEQVMAAPVCSSANPVPPRIQRFTEHAAEQADLAPASVGRVLAGSGRPLEPALRHEMGQRFGYDFSRVRVHIGAAAEQSARDVSAHAYTVGNNIVFGQRQFAPWTQVGRQLIAHELTHVVQQVHGNVNGLRTQLTTGSDDSPAECEAETVASVMLFGQEAGSVGSSSIGSTLQRKNDEPIEVELVPSEPVPGVDLPRVSPETWRLIGGNADNAGKTLSEPERQKIATITKDKVPTSSPLAFTEGPRFLLHDTAGLLSAAKLTEEQKLGRGPLGAGVTAWVARSGGAVVARPQFFEARRPSTSEFEKAADIIEQGPREQAFRKVWTVTSGKEKTDALDRALDGLGLTEKELKTEKKSAQDQLNAVSGKIFTTAAWTVGEICSRVGAAGARSIAAVPDKEGELSAGCATLADYFRTRTGRVSSMMTVEILQESGLKKTKAKDKTVSENACNPANPNLKPLPKPAYTDSQYAEIVLLYLRACLQAGLFPEITTHFRVDAFKRGHCDPRCFDLNLLYKTIARSLGQDKKSTYGVKPSYGTKWGTNTVWWDNTVCGGGPPT